MSKTFIIKYINSYFSSFGYSWEANDCSFHNVQDSSTMQCIEIKDTKNSIRYHGIISDLKQIDRFDNLENSITAITVPIQYYVLHKLAEDYPNYFTRLVLNNSICTMNGVLLLLSEIPKDSVPLRELIFLKHQMFGKDLIIPLLDLCLIATRLYDVYSVTLDPIKLKLFFDKNNHIRICSGLDSKTVNTIWKVKTNQPLELIPVSSKDAKSSINRKKNTPNKLVAERLPCPADGHKLNLFMNKEPARYSKMVKSIFDSYFTCSTRVNKPNLNPDIIKYQHSHCSSSKGCIFKSNMILDDYVHEIYCKKYSIINIFEISLIRNFPEPWQISEILRLKNKYKWHEENCVKCLPVPGLSAKKN
jgi:hypothetical protein